MLCWPTYCGGDRAACCDGGWAFATEEGFVVVVLGLFSVFSFILLTFICLVVKAGKVFVVFAW